MPIKEKLILYSPHAKQLEFHNSPKRYRVAAFGRQSGKSTACLNELLKRAWEKPSQTLWFLSPTFDQAKNQYRRLVGMLWKCNGILLKKNQTELRVKLVNQSQIIFKSGETLDNLRGSTIHGAVIDEVRDQHVDLWPMIIRPMLATTKGWCAFVSTPNGFDQFYDLFEHAKLNPDEWDLFQAPSTCNPLITEQELKDARTNMSESQYAQEYLAEFRELHAGTAYVNFGEHNMREDCPWAKGKLYSEHLPILVGMDFNNTPMAWVLMQERGGQFWAFDEIYLKKTHTQEAMIELLDRLKKYPTISTPRVLICGDATGKALKTSSAGKTDYSIVMQALTEAGIPFHNLTPESNPLVKDRINMVNAALKTASGDVNFWIHKTNVPFLRRDFQRVAWKKGANAVLDQTTDSSLTHISDAAGYPVCALSRVWTSNAGGLRVIRR